MVRPFIGQMVKSTGRIDRPVGPWVMTTLPTGGRLQGVVTSLLNYRFFPDFQIRGNSA
jgi:hypothetical protein